MATQSLKIDPVVNSYRVTAQSFTSDQHIARVVSAACEADVLPMVSPALEAAGFYVTSIVGEG